MRSAGRVAGQHVGRAQRRGHPDQGQTDERRRIDRLDALEQCDATTLDPEGAGAVEGSVGRDIGSDLLAVERAEHAARFVDMLAPVAGLQADDRDSGVKQHRLTRLGRELGAGCCGITGLAEHAVTERADLIGADHDSVRISFGHGPCLGECEAPRERVRRFARSAALIDVGRLAAEFDAEPLEQRSAVAGGRREPDGAGQRGVLGHVCIGRGKQWLRAASFDSPRRRTYYTRPMSPDRSLSFDVDRLPAQGGRQEVRLSLVELPRLSSGLAADTGVVDAKIEFDRLDGMPLLAVQVATDVELVCQRCLQTVRLRLESHSRVALVETMQQADRLPGDVEPVWIEGRRVDLTALVDEELLLALPLVPMHERDDPSCGVTAAEHCEDAPVRPPVKAEAASAVQKPFAELGELLKRRK